MKKGIMKLTLSMISCVLMFGLCGMRASAVNLYRYSFDNTIFADYVMENYDLNHDNCLNDEELAAVTSLDLRYMNLKSLRDIKYFTSLRQLDVRYNDLTELDLSQNTALTSLKCSYNYLTSLDVSNNKKLKTLYFAANNISTIDLSANTALTDVHFGYNSLGCLNLDNNSKISEATGSKNYHVLNGTKTESGQYSYNLAAIPGFDAAKASNWSAGKVSGGKLVVDAGVREVSFTYSIRDDISAVFYLICFQPIKLNEVNFPDETLRSYLTASYDTNENGYLSYSEVSDLTEISTDTISSGAGIENLFALKQLGISNYTGTSLDLSKCHKLEKISISRNSLTKLTLGSAVKLEHLACRYGKLEKLDISKCSHLKTLYVNNNKLSAIDLNGNALLTTVDVSFNQLTKLDTGSNSKLELIWAQHNSLTEFIAGEGLENFFGYNNQLSSMDLSRASKLVSLKVYVNQLTALDLTNAPDLEYLDCSDNPISTLNLANNKELYSLNADSCNLTRLNLTYCGKLNSLSVSENPLETLNLIKCGELMYLNCNTSKLTALDLASCVKLKSLECCYGNLSTIDLSGCPDLWWVYLKGNQLTELDVTGNKELMLLEVSENPLRKLQVKNLEKLYELSAYSCQLTNLDIQGCKALTESSVSVYNQEYTMVTQTTGKGVSYLPYSNFPEGFAAAKASDWGDADPKTQNVIVAFNDFQIQKYVSYSYDIGEGIKKQFRIIAVRGENSLIRQPVTDRDNPGILTGHEGEKSRLSVATRLPEERCTYQWQKSSDGAKWVTSSSAGSKSNELTIENKLSFSGLQFRCQVTYTSEDGRNVVSVYSNPVKLNVLQSIRITGQPMGQSVCPGEQISFHVTAQGEGLKYQWMKSVDGGKTWVRSSSAGAAADTLTMTTKESYNGLSFRCVITDKYGRQKTSETAGLQVYTPSITQEPSDMTVDAGKTATFHVGTISHSPTYQWYKSTNQGKTWVRSSSTGAATDTLSVVTKASFNGFMFKCVVKDGSGKVMETRPATLQVLSGENRTPLKVSPMNDCELSSGGTYDIFVNAEGEGLTFQWKKSVDGGLTWVNSSSAGAKTQTLTLEKKTKFSGYMFKCVVKDRYGIVVETNAFTVYIK